MPSGRRWSVSDGRKLVTAILVVLAVFIVCAALGSGAWLLAAVGVALLAAGGGLYVVSAMNSRSYSYVPGTAYVVACSAPPTGGSQYGRCEMQVVVHAAGGDDVSVKVRDVGVPVAKWPSAGSTLPILVALGDRRRVRVLWDRVRTHGDLADSRLEEFDGERMAEEPVDFFDTFGQDEAENGPATVEDDLIDPGDGGANVIEMDVIDPQTFGRQPGPGTAPAGVGAPVGLVEQSAPADGELAGAGAAGMAGAATMAAGVGAAAAGTTRRRPSPRPRPAPSTEALAPAAPAAPTPVATPEPVSAAGAGASPAGSPSGEAAATPSAPPSLRVQQLLPAEPPAVAIPELATGADEEPTGEISDAYLAITAPPGQPDSGRVHGVGVTLFVTNLGRSVAFYRDLLGFVQIAVGPGSAVLESGDGRIVLRRVMDMPPVDRRLVHLMLEVPDVAEAYEDLRARGVDFVHRPRPVSRYEQLELISAAFRDPDGHGIALIKWDLPAA